MAKFLKKYGVFPNRSNERLLVDVMSVEQKVVFGFLVLVWFFSLMVFWIWWLNPIHFLGWFGTIVNSVVLAWTMVLPGYYFFFVSRMKKPNPNLRIPSGLRVAMVVTKAPSEPFSIVRETLEAMLSQEYPHDNWLADEDPTKETIAWCKKNNVQISTRKGVVEYHRSSWPRRTKSKEGNLAFFYDTYGYRMYDFVAQLDADHRPDIGYLEEVIRPFADASVGYVSAPSICDTNAKTSWAARARLYAESTMHGSLQAGYNNGWAPLCIGSHYAVRTQALKQIGGLGPELAEDHSTTFLMNVHGWKGVHALDAIAHGDGPANFADCMTQEFQWSRSLANLLFTLTPKHWQTLSAKLKFQFLFAQLWYPLFGIAMLVSYLLPIWALVNQTPWINVSYANFLLYSFPVTFMTVLIVVWVRSLSVLRPHNAKILSWEIVIFQLTRWPWILWGTVSAFIDSMTKKNFEFRVTPKGKVISQSLPMRIVLPYIVLALFAAVIAIVQTDPGAARGYYYFLLVASAIYAFSLVVIVVRNKHETRLRKLAYGH